MISFRPSIALASSDIDCTINFKSLHVSSATVVFCASSNSMIFRFVPAALVLPFLLYLFFFSGVTMSRVTSSTAACFLLALEGSGCLPAFACAGTGLSWW